MKQLLLAFFFVTGIFFFSSIEVGAQATNPGPTIQVSERCFFFFKCNVTADANISGTINDLGNWAQGKGADTRGASNSSTISPQDGIAGYLVKIGIFINNVLIPLLFGLALLFFLFNIFRYFINPANVEERDKAKSAAIYGVAAFVFLVSIWGIVNLLVSGLVVDQRTSICPDYLGSWCGDKSSGGSFSGVTTASDGSLRVPTPTDGSTPALVDFGCGSGINIEKCKGGAADNYSALAEFVFGAFEDTSALNFHNGVPRASASTVNLNQNLSCTEGLELLIRAANVEPNQAAYVFFTQNSGGTKWQNVTDVNGRASLEYDADTIQSAIAAGSDVLLVQMNTKANASAARFNSLGYGPSASDYDLMCDGIVRDLPLITVDWTGVWKTTHNGSLACPRTVQQEDSLRTIDTFYALSMLSDNDVRNSEFALLLKSDALPRQFQAPLLKFETTNFNRLSPEQIRNLVSTELADIKLQSVRSSIEAVCTGR